MIPDDQYRLEREQAIGSLEAWADSISDVADVEYGEDDAVWRLVVTPHADTACAFELGIRSDQFYDISLAGRFYEDIPVTRMTLFIDLVQAIADGRVIRRHFARAATGLETAAALSILFSSGEIWAQITHLAQPCRHDPEASIAREFHYLPYRVPTVVPSKTA